MLIAFAEAHWMSQVLNYLGRKLPTYPTYWIQARRMKKAFIGPEYLARGASKYPLEASLQVLLNGICNKGTKVRCLDNEALLSSGWSPLQWLFGKRQVFDEKYNLPSLCHCLSSWEGSPNLFEFNAQRRLDLLKSKMESIVRHTQENNKKKGRSNTSHWEEPVCYAGGVIYQEGR